MFTIRKTYKVEYAHQLKSAYSAACHETIHGHSGMIELFFISNVLDENKMVVDFGEVSGLVKDYLMKTYDHALIIPSSFDKSYIKCLQKYNKKLMVVDNNPTAESFCETIFWDITTMLTPIINPTRQFFLYKVRFHETDTGYAEYVPQTHNGVPNIKKNIA